ncbi:Dps family protein [Caulobacter soli]|uniref:Dps family protein n=1 Tax=Caulobacter soli TaxID=2708539 RepID=UPI0013E9EC05|nr:DNA starvation/stationary phase protection protein [Caulobacter soli]
MQQTSQGDTQTLARGDNVLEISEALNAILADVFALYMKTKNFHWHVWGPHFRDHHLLFDDQASQLLAITDEIAERVRKSGAFTLHSIGDIARRQRILDNNGKGVAAADMLEELRQDNQALVASLREAKALADRAGDNATSGLIDGWTDQAEGRAWFLLEAGRSA